MNEVLYFALQLEDDIKLADYSFPYSQSLF
jgi:hypothetical protein